MMNFGLQKRVSWTGTDDGPLSLLDQDGKGDRLVRVSAWGEALFDLAYGTQATSWIVGLRSPMVAYVPGSVTVTARPLVAGQGTARCTCHPVSSPGIPLLRALYDAAGPISPQGFRAQCLVAGTIQTAGANVPLTPGEVLLLAGPSAVVSGSHLVEIDL